MAYTNGSGDILDSEDMRKIFVAKIPLGSKDEDLKEFFENICGGSVTDLLVIRKENAKTNFGFFTFETSHLVDEVIYKEKELIFNNSTLEVNRAVPKKDYLTESHHKTKKLFLNKIPKSGVTEEELKNYFEALHDPKYGTIESILFIKEKDAAGNRLEENKGFGFITVSCEHLANTMAIQHASIDFCGHKMELRKDRDGQAGGQRGGRGGRGGGRGGGQSRGAYNSGGYGYGGYDQWDYGYYGAPYGIYPQYGVSSAQPSAKAGRGGRGARGGRGGNRYIPYAKKP